MPRDDLPALVKQAALNVIAGLEMAADDPGFTVAGRCYGLIDQDDSNVTMPCWLLVTEADREKLFDLDTEWKGRLFSFKALLRDSRGPGDHSKDAQYRSWRQEVIEAFHQKRPITAKVPQCYWCEVETENVYDPKKDGFQDVQGSVRLKISCRVPRYHDNPVQTQGVALPAALGRL